MKKILGILFLVLIAIQFIRPNKINPPTNDKIALHAPKEVSAILIRSCYDCHSNTTKWPWYANIAPLSWSIAGHVHDGREAINFSQWKTIDPKIKIKRLKRAIKTIRNGMMPLPTYLWLHQDAKLNSKEKKILEDWFNAQLVQ